MHDRTKRLVWTVLAVMLPGPWTPVIVLAYILGRAVERDQDTAHHDPAMPPYPPPDPYACVPVHASANPYARSPMSSYTDFYVGRGEYADWIGSLRGECYPDNFLAVPPVLVALTTTDENTFRAAVADALQVWEGECLGQGYRSHLGWPWLSHTSHNSSWIITFDPGPEAVFVTVGGGVAWHQIDPRDPRFPEGDDPLGPPDIYAWLCDPAAPPSVPLPLMRDPVTGLPTPAGGA